MSGADQQLSVLQDSRSQNTIAHPVVFSGTSLFHGYDVTVRLLPAGINTGIVFRRIDLSNEPDIPALWKNVTTVPRRTVLAASQHATVETVEHLMAALAGLGVDNCIAEIDAPEVPAFDGSCRDFCDGILTAGLQPLDALTPIVRIPHPVSVSSQSGQTITAAPPEGPFSKVTYLLNYGPDAPIPPQTLTAEITPDWFYQHISAARTFVLESEINALKKMGFGLHLTAKDIVVLGKDGVIDNDLRWADEGVRHKILDCVGDFALSGIVFCGQITATRSGHHLNHEMAAELSKTQQGSSPSANRAA